MRTVLILQWAEVLSADAFSAFEDVGLDNDEVCSGIFEPVLSLSLSWARVRSSKHAGVYLLVLTFCHTTSKSSR